MDSESNKASDQYRLVINLPDNVTLKRSDKNTMKNIKKPYKTMLLD